MVNSVQAFPEILNTLAVNKLEIHLVIVLGDAELIVSQINNKKHLKFILNIERFLMRDNSDSHIQTFAEFYLNCIYEGQF
jgi:hypothetical protein